jgi:leader peptidase (prepilin peptidase)/N-methyltransferase
MVLIIVILLGLVFGSFATVLSYRIPRSLNWISGRSKCTKCKTNINWFDNIPVISYILLKGKCRNCNGKISLRYPLIEIGLTIIFVITYFAWMAYPQGSQILGIYRNSLGVISLAFLLFVFFLNYLILLIDLENKVIPDEIVFFLLAIISSVFLLTGNTNLFLGLVCGLSVALFLLLINLFTKGKGMGLGDVKLAIPIGLFLGYPLTLLWILLSFVLGAIVAVSLLALVKQKVKMK